MIDNEKKTVIYLDLNMKMNFLFKKYITTLAFSIDISVYFFLIFTLQTF